MLKNFFTVAWRSLVKNRLSSFINIFGLSIGLATAILIFVWINDTLSYNKFHKNYANIHLLMKTERANSGASTGSSVSGMLAGALRAEIPEVRYAARGTFENPLLKYGNKSLYEDAIYVDPDFFRIMTFPALQGDPANVLLDPGSVVITESTAKKIFGSQDPMGKIITHNNLHQLKVGAVIRDVPEHSSYQFGIVLPFALFEKENDWLKKWDDNRILTWALLTPQVQLSVLDAKLTRLQQQKTGDKQEELFAYPLEDVWLRNSFKNGHTDGGRIDILKLTVALGLFVLLIACINFMNMATARSERRSREVGVRKTLGASRPQLVFQFLSEAVLQTFFALFPGILLAKITLPFIQGFLSKNTISFDLTSGRIWLGLLGMGLFTALVAGSYPAFFLSRFQPVLVLKGLFAKHYKGGSLLRKSLVTFQFVITIFLIISVIVLLRQDSYVQNRPIGYDQENLIGIPARGEMASTFPLVKADLLKLPGVTQVSAGTDNLVRFNGGSNGVDWPGKTPDQDFYVKMSHVQYDWVSTTGLKMAEGRDFSPAFGTDTSACLLNEAAVRRMGLKEPVIGTKVGGAIVIGVVKDFLYNDAFNNPDPLVVDLSAGPMPFFFVRIRNNEQWQQTIAQIEQAMKKVNPNFPFEFHFTSEQYQNQFKGIESTVKTLNWIGGLAILLSCLGLFGLSAFMAEQRTKEIGIRKILGAGIPQIWVRLSGDFLKPVLIAFLVAVPLAGWAMQFLLQHFDYHVQLSWWIFALAGAMAFLIALATVSYQGIRAALANPVESLRTE
ncbi:MAG TPA: ABC transporter permease [Puia sp.]|nr:ABC transporter permease [Puia sp.]